MVVFVIFGTVVGSGFASGKEIMVFFSRFGAMSYLYIVLAGLFFFFIFLFFLTFGRKIVKHYENSFILQSISFFISLIFCSSMFAGINNLFSYFPKTVSILLLISLVVFCFISTFKGLLMPITSILFLAMLIYCSTRTSSFNITVSPFAGVLYSPLYVALNTCMSGVIISKIGEGLNKKQTILTCLFSTLLLLIFLFLGNFVLLSNGESFFSEMPFLFLTSENSLMFAVSYFVILSGCLTTLISLCYTIKTTMDKIIKNQFFSTGSSIFLPMGISVLGFSQIVSLVYPFCSVLGIFMLLYLIFVELKNSKT